MKTAFVDCVTEPEFSRTFWCSVAISGEGAQKWPVMLL